LNLNINFDANFEDGKSNLRLMFTIIYTCNFYIRVDPGEI